MLARLLAGALLRIVGAACCAGAALLPASAQTSTPSSLSDAGRQRLNFNADWHFKLGSVAGGERPELDDSGWEKVGLPHSFSMPYFRAPAFYTGDGWYRKVLTLPQLPADRRLSLEFEGAFQDARVYVNGVEVGHHRGGYTGFPVDISKAVRPGRNLIAVRVNNDWDARLAPRAGEHVFSGGLYRDETWVAGVGSQHVNSVS